jgi:copper chaperone CopZ
VRARPKGIARKTGINVLPILLYVGVAAVVTVGMYAWDVQYRRGVEASRRPPEPEVIARNLVENIIGAGTVKDVKVDKDKKTVTVTFESTQFKPERPKKELRDLLEAEAILAASAILSQMREYGQVNTILVKDGKTLATAEAARGRERPTMNFVDERLRD